MLKKLKSYSIKYFILVWIFQSESFFAQSELIMSLLAGDDFSRKPLCCGVEYLYKFNAGERVFIYAGINAEIIQNFKRKRKYFNNYEFDKLPPIVQEFVRSELFLVRKSQHILVFVGPRIGVGTKMEIKNIKLYQWFGKHLGCNFPKIQ